MFIKALIKKYVALRETNDSFAFFTTPVLGILSVLIVLVICQPW